MGVPLLALAAFGIVMWSTFDGVAPIRGGARVGPAVTVDDDYVSCFILEGAEGAVALIDTCQDPESAALLSALNELGHDRADVQAIFLTHGHHDHRGGIARFEHAVIYAHEDELPLLRGEVAARGPVPRLGGREDPIEGVRAVADGEVVELGGLRIEALHMPGHTDGSVAWLIEDTLFLGDNAHAMEDGTVEAAPWVFSDDQATNRASLRALVERLEARPTEIRELVFSHSGPLSGMAQLSGWARSHPR